MHVKKSLVRNQTIHLRKGSRWKNNQCVLVWYSIADEICKTGNKQTVCCDVEPKTYGLRKAIYCK